MRKGPVRGPLLACAGSCAATVSWRIFSIGWGIELKLGAFVLVLASVALTGCLQPRSWGERIAEQRRAEDAARQQQAAAAAPQGVQRPHVRVASFSDQRVAWGQPMGLYLSGAPGASSWCGAGIEGTAILGTTDYELQRHHADSSAAMLDREIGRLCPEAKPIAVKG